MTTAAKRQLYRHYNCTRVALNRELSISLQSRLTLAIVLSPGNYPQDNFLPPEGAWAFPLRYNVHAHVIVSSPGFSLWLNPAPREGDLP